MNLVDTHCHLYLEEFASDRTAMLQRAIEAGVHKFYLPAIDSSTTTALQGLESAYPGKCFAMTGLHPCSVKANYLQELELVQQSLATRSFAAIGEIGLDYHWDRTFEKEQAVCFHQQVEWALTYDIPIVIHCRQSMAESIEVVKSHQRGQLRGIFHCFSGDYKSAMQIIDLGFYLGIGGVVTYKNAGLAEVIEQIELQHIVLETDSPYLTPVPFRGKRNESSYLKYIAEKIAAIKKLDVQKVADITSSNAAKIFGC